MPIAKRETIKASELQRSSGKVLKRIANDREHLIVESGGYRVAVMLPYLHYERIIRAQAARNMKAVLDTAGAVAYTDAPVAADPHPAVQGGRRRPRKKPRIGACST